MRKASWLASGLLIIAAPAAAQRVQPWPDLLVTAPITQDWQLSGEVIGRIGDDVRTSQLETRVEIGRTVSKRVTLWAGWVHVASYNPNAPDSHEDQAVEQLNWKVAEIGRARLSGRTRLEQRFVEHVDATSWRLRQQARLSVGLGDGKRSPSAVLWAEPYFALNRTAAQAHTLDQLRSFVGVSVPLSPHADLEIGYLNQRLYKANRTLVNDCVPIVLSIKL